MATLRQKKLAKNIVENLQAKKPLNKQELVVSSGYSEMSAKSSAHIILEQKGVQEELGLLGFDEDSAKKVVKEILQFGEDDSVKLKAADLIFKVQGSYAPEKHTNLNVNVGMGEDIQTLANAAAKLLKDKKT